MTAPPLLAAATQAITLINAARTWPLQEAEGVPPIFWEMITKIETNLSSAIETTDLRQADTERWRNAHLLHIEDAGGLGDPRIGRLFLLLLERDGAELLSDIAVSRLADALSGPTPVA